jgi:hypothetical protein
MGVGALLMQGGARLLGLAPLPTTSVTTLSALSFRGRKDQARLTEELGMRLAGIQCSCFELSAWVTTRPLPSSRLTTSSSPTLSAPQSAANLTRAPGATYSVGGATSSRCSTHGLLPPHIPFISFVFFLFFFCFFFCDFGASASSAEL